MQKLSSTREMKMFYSPSWQHEDCKENGVSLNAKGTERRREAQAVTQVQSASCQQTVGAEKQPTYLAGET